jgi:hypothetical protein
MIDGIEFNSSTINPLTARRAERMRQRLAQLGLTWVEVRLDSSVKAGRLFPATQKIPRRK